MAGQSVVGLAIAGLGTADITGFIFAFEARAVVRVKVIIDSERLEKEGHRWFFTGFCWTFHLKYILMYLCLIVIKNQGL